MSISKTKIYNLTLSALLLAKEVSEVDTDTSNEVRILNTHWDLAYESTLQDLDLDSLSQPITLELIANLTNNTDYNWDYVYKYPSKCVFLRRIESSAVTDTRDTHIAKRTGIYNGVNVIFTNEVNAVAECITNDIPITALSPMAAMAVAYSLASMSAPLIVGKGSQRLRKDLQEAYKIFKGEAQEQDVLENFNYEDESQRSEFVAARLS